MFIRSRNAVGLEGGQPEEARNSRVGQRIASIKVSAISFVAYIGDGKNNDGSCLNLTDDDETDGG